MCCVVSIYMTLIEVVASAGRKDLQFKIHKSREWSGKKENTWTNLQKANIDYKANLLFRMRICKRT